MLKYFLVPLLLLLCGCSNWKINAAMCEQLASEPNSTIPKECKDYNEKEAKKAFDNLKNKKQSKEDIVEFNRDNENEEEN